MWLFTYILQLAYYSLNRRVLFSSLLPFTFSKLWKPSMAPPTKPKPHSFLQTEPLSTLIKNPSWLAGLNTLVAYSATSAKWQTPQSSRSLSSSQSRNSMSLPQWKKSKLLSGKWNLGSPRDRTGYNTIQYNTLLTLPKGAFQWLCTIKIKYTKYKNILL